MRRVLQKRILYLLGATIVDYVAVDIYQDGFLPDSSPLLNETGKVGAELYGSIKKQKAYFQ
ncbi:MAG: hypothetical protein K9L17_11270 [Clostridiales bacterium]|nr:hypothetical protein [Clostridiales bacterium]MCF8023262.1 hypothetical protein [Clostridiales bacterium]